MVRTRFAPSPTGFMHVGNLRTALYEYLVAKSQNGTFVLRIEDTDQERYVEGATDVIYNTLQQVGLQHDEGPDIGGEYGPYVQSERKDIYKPYAEQLVREGKAYYCFCTKERLESIHQDGEFGGYDRHCRDLPAEEIRKNLDAGMPYVIRQRVPLEGSTSFEDAVYGTITIENKEIEDQVLLKSDGYPTYNFANVVDDHLMGITHVVRGNEYLSSAPKYNRLYEAFGWEVPVYVHCPLITNEEHQKLSKRSGHSSYEDLLDQGFVSEAIVNYVALLGWCPQDNREIFSLQELVEAFDYHNMSKSPAVFDIQKLRWMNGEYLKAMDPEIFYEAALPYLKKALTKELDLHKIAEMVRTRIEVYPEITDMVSFFETLPEYDTDLFTNKKSKNNAETAAATLQALLPRIEAQETFTNDALFEMLKTYTEENGCKVNFVMWPLRVAVSGKTVTPAGATEIMEIIGKDETVARIHTALKKLGVE